MITCKKCGSDWHNGGDYRVRKACARRLAKYRSRKSFDFAVFLCFCNNSINGFVSAICQKNRSGLCITDIHMVNAIHFLVRVCVFVFFYDIRIKTNIICKALKFHDINKSAWWLFIALVPLVGGIVLLVFMCTDSVNENNKYGKRARKLCYENRRRKLYSSLE